jgi:hypothetical protein
MVSMRDGYRPTRSGSLHPDGDPTGYQYRDIYRDNEGVLETVVTHP